MGSSDAAGSRPGRFITFEGGEGAGKTTQIALLARTLRAAGHAVVTTREPGGTPAAERMRDILLSDIGADLSPAAQAVLVYAARQDHLDKVIRPGLAAGAFVLCDRFHDSTVAYQGAGGAADEALLETLRAAVVASTTPSLTILLDLPPNMGLERAQARSADRDTFEDKDVAFHERLRAAFLRIAETEPDRVAVFDAMMGIETLSAAIRGTVAARFESVSA